MFIFNFLSCEFLLLVLIDKIINLLLDKTLNQLLKTNILIFKSVLIFFFFGFVVLYHFIKKHILFILLTKCMYLFQLKFWHIG